MARSDVSSNSWPGRKFCSFCPLFCVRSLAYLSYTFTYLFIYLFIYLSFFAVPRPFPHSTESLLFPAAFIVKQLLKFRLLVGFKGGGRV